MRRYATAGGSAVQETQFPGTPMEMVSVYHLDGADLVMTHYCVLGNQPRMKADPKSPADKIHFTFASGTKVAPELASLTEQELAILGHIAEGLTNRQIGERMFLAEKTVKNYVSAILAKLGLERRTQAAVLASKLLG